MPGVKLWVGLASVIWMLTGAFETPVAAQNGMTGRQTRPPLSDWDVDTSAANGKIGIGGAVHAPSLRSALSREAAEAATALEGGEAVDYYLSLLSGAEGPCVGWTTNPAQSLTTASASAVLALYDQCPAAVADTVPPSVVAEAEVLRFWQSKPVPPIHPEIDPGYAIAGLRAYLETGAESSTQTGLTFDTPVGRAEMDIAADYLVDWGDGSAVEIYAVRGEPWPDGQISHVFQWAEPVTVSVAQQWSGSWRMVNGVAAGVGGQLPVLPVSESVDLVVDQIQAVVG